MFAGGEARGLKQSEAQQNLLEKVFVFLKNFIFVII